MELTAGNVADVFVECQCDENTENAKGPVKGVIHTVYFDLDALRRRHGDIEDLLDELPEGFHEGKGGGWSFLQACQDRHGRHWGEHIDMEKLFLLGLAIGRVREPEPMACLRDVLPGGMPYYVIDRRKA